MIKPLDLMREVRDDQSLTTGQKAFLMVAVLRTDNKTGRVRASQEMLAADAGINEKSIRRYLMDKEVAKYFTITKVGRMVNLDWLPIVDMVSSIDESDTGHGVPDSGHGVHNTGHGVHPSAFASASSSAKDMNDQEKDGVNSQPSLVSVNPKPSLLENKVAEVKKNKSQYETDLLVAIQRRHREISSKEDPALVAKAMALALASDERHKYPATFVGRMAYAKAVAA